MKDRYQHWLKTATEDSDILVFIEGECARAKQRRDSELIIMMYEVETKGWSLSRFINTFYVLYEKNYGHAPTPLDNQPQ